LRGFIKISRIRRTGRIGRDYLIIVLRGFIKISRIGRTGRIGRDYLIIVWSQLGNNYLCHIISYFYKAVNTDLSP